jgi:hypothetical protein
MNENTMPAVEKPDKPGFLDRIQEKITSRKLMVWLTATALMAFYGLESSDWVAISLVYIGSQAAVDLAKVWKGA